MTGRTHVAALADRVREAAGRLAQTENELETAAREFARRECWGPGIMLWETVGGDGEILESVIATEHQEIDDFARDPRAPRMSRRGVAGWRQEAHARLSAAAAEWEGKRNRALGAIERRRADQLIALSRHLRRLRRARVTCLADVVAKLSVIVELPAELCEPDALAKAAIRDLGDVGGIAP